MKVADNDSSFHALQSILWQYDNAPSLVGLFKGVTQMFDAKVESFYEWFQDHVFGVFAEDKTTFSADDSFGLDMWGITIGLPRPAVVPYTDKTRTVKVGTVMSPSSGTITIGSASYARYSDGDIHNQPTTLTFTTWVNASGDLLYTATETPVAGDQVYSGSPSAGISPVTGSTVQSSSGNTIAVGGVTYTLKEDAPVFVYTVYHEYYAWKNGSTIYLTQMPSPTASSIVYSASSGSVEPVTSVSIGSVGGGSISVAGVTYSLDSEDGSYYMWRSADGTQYVLTDSSVPAAGASAYHYKTGLTGISDSLYRNILLGLVYLYDSCGDGASIAEYLQIAFDGKVAYLDEGKMALYYTNNLTTTSGGTTFRCYVGTNGEAYYTDSATPTTATKMYVVEGGILIQTDTTYDADTMTASAQGNISEKTPNTTRTSAGLTGEDLEIYLLLESDTYHDRVFPYPTGVRTNTETDDTSLVIGLNESASTGQDLRNFAPRKADANDDSVNGGIFGLGKERAN